MVPMWWCLPKNSKIITMNLKGCIGLVDLTGETIAFDIIN